MDGEATLGVVDQAEVLAGLFNYDHVHEAGWVGGVGADLAIDLDEALHHDGLGFASVKGILQTANKAEISTLVQSAKPKEDAELLTGCE